MEGFIYLGEYIDILGREISISDKKIGISVNPLSRQNQLNKTKGPIGYRIITLFKVDNMNKVEKMLHAILDSRRIHGEWFKDDEDTLTSEFINFMNVYGAEFYNIEEEKEQILEPEDMRLVDLSKNLTGDLTLIRRYKGVDYEVVLDKKGLLHFNGEIFDTPNKLYNNGIVKHVNGKRGGSGTNHLSQFVIKETGERLED